jgi:hypothetical protein
MRLVKLAAIAAVAAGLAGCMSIPKSQTVAEYCANPSKANENVCRLKLEIDGNSTALADTNMSLNKARMIADTSLRAANEAQASADRAMNAANGAMSLARSAMLKEEDLFCKTRTVQKSNTGTCEPGYTVMGCTQTRYTHSAGGLSFLRDVNDKQCRFNSKVLEMQVRCCAVAPTMTAASAY